MLPDVLIIGTQAWERLSEQQQQWLKEAVDESIDYQRKLWAEAESEALKQVQKAGVTVIRPYREPFMQKVAKLYEGYKDQQEIYELIKEIQGSK
jgi:TRAP-type C4-dicarboxylate transport system substrate-binding protein